MIWNKISIKTTTFASDIISSVLIDNNICGVEICDNVPLSDFELSQMHVDIPINQIDNGEAFVNFYVAIVEKIENKKIDVKCIDNSYIPSTDNIFTKNEFKEILSNIKNDLNFYKSIDGIYNLTFSIEQLEDNEFLNKWKNNFKEIEFDNIKIVPSFKKDKYLQNDDNVIFIEPGNAFGTGQHETTKLCLLEINKLFIERNIKNVLDLGCGTGILGIFSLKKGAEKICAIDIDKYVENNLIDNLNHNDILFYNKLEFDNDFKFHYSFGDILNDNSLVDKISQIKYDVVIANILAPVIIEFLNNGNIDKFLVENGYFVCSGIFIDSEKDVLNAINNNENFKIKYKIVLNQWVCFVLERIN